jgi:hypothetical protein
MYRSSIDPRRRDKKSYHIFVITCALTSAALGPAYALESPTCCTATSAPLVTATIKPAVALTGRLVQHTDNAPVDGSQRLLSWSAALARSLDSPVRSDEYKAAWLAHSSEHAHLPATAVYDEELTFHRPFADELFLRVSVGVAYQPRLTGASRGYPALGLSLVRPFN